MNIEKLRLALPGISEDTIRKYFVYGEIKKGDYFIKEGQVCRKIAFINGGMIRHFYATDSKEVTRWVSLENHFCTSLFSFIKQEKSFENMEAIQDCELLSITRQGWEEMYATLPAFKEIWVKSMEASSINMEERIFSFVAKNADERYAYMLNRWPQFIQKVPVQYVASMLGTTPRHLSRIRRARAGK
jgi:CRP/FNR family transcriptional regulator, anaerobic regulatory protein